MSDDLHLRVQEIFQEVISEDLTLHDDLTAGAVDGWDSLSHVSIVYAIEEEFDIEFSQREMAELANVGDLKRLIEHKLSRS